MKKTDMPAKDITLKAAWKASDHTPYMVVTHIKNEKSGEAGGKSTGESDGESTGETLVTETRYGTTDEPVTIQMPDKAGYITPAAQTKKIAADGSTRFDFTYYPKTYKLTVHVGRGVRLSLDGSPVSADTAANISSADKNMSGDRSYSWTFAYGREVNLQAALEKGYENLQISGSTDSDAGNSSATEFSMPDHDLELTMHADPVTYHILYTRGVYDTAGLPDSYTIEDLPLALKTPRMPVLTSFEGWQNAQGKTVQSIPAGETGDLRLTGIVADYRAVAAADGIGIILLIVVAVMSKGFPSRKKLRFCQHKPNP